MAAILIGILLLVGAAALWHYSTGSLPVLLACVALGLVGAILLVVGLLAVLDSNGVQGAAAGPLAATLRSRRKRARRLEKVATGLRTNRLRAVRESQRTYR